MDVHQDNSYQSDQPVVPQLDRGALKELIEQATVLLETDDFRGAILLAQRSLKQIDQLPVIG